MAVHKVLKADSQRPFYVLKTPLVDVFQDQAGTYWVNTEIARIYYYILQYYRIKEPEHPLLQPVSTEDRHYVTIDLRPDALGAMEDRNLYQRPHYYPVEHLRAISRRVDLERTPLLDYLVDRYSVGEVASVMYLTSRRSRQGEQLYLPKELLPVAEALNLNLNSSTPSLPTGVTADWVGRKDGTYALSCNYLLRSYSLRDLGVYRQGRHPLHDFTSTRVAARTPIFSPGNQTPLHRWLYPRRGEDLNTLLADFHNQWEKQKQWMDARQMDPEVAAVLEEKLTMGDWQAIKKLEESIAVRTNRSNSKGLGSYREGAVTNYYGRMEDYAFLAWLMEEYKVGFLQENTTFLQRRDIRLQPPFLPDVLEKPVHLEQLVLL